MNSAVLVVQTSYSNAGFDKTFSLGWRLNRLPPPVRRTADVTLKTPCLTMDCPRGCSSGEGSLLALPINAADGTETWPFVS